MCWCVVKGALVCDVAMYVHDAGGFVLLYTDMHTI